MSNNRTCIGTLSINSFLLGPDGNDDGNKIVTKMIRMNLPEKKIGQRNDMGLSNPGKESYGPGRIILKIIF